MTGQTGHPIPRLGHWPNLEPRFWRGQLVERQWYDGRLGAVLGWDDEDHCWVHWRIRADPSQVQIECEAAEDLIAWYPVNPLHTATTGDLFQAPDTERGSTAMTVERLRRDVHTLAEGGPRNRVSNPRRLAAARDYVQQELATAGWQPRVREFEVRAKVGITDRGRPRALWPLRLHRGIAGVNIVASRRPDEPPGLLVVAHLDSCQNSPGADDNASGVAVALEIARAIPSQGAGGNVTVALVDLEETGLMGSRALVEQISRPTAVLCLESIGYFSTDPGSHQTPRAVKWAYPDLTRDIRGRDHRADFLVAIHRANSAHLAAAWARHAASAGAHGLTLQDPRWTGPGARLTGQFAPVSSNLDRSDHAPFWNRGIPAVALTGIPNLRNPNYHRPTDTPDTVDYERLAAVSAATVGFVRERIGQ